MSEWPPPPQRNVVRDLLGGTDPYEAAIRAGRTALQAFLASLLAVPALDVTAVQAAGFAALTAVLSFAQGLLVGSK